MRGVDAAGLLVLAAAWSISFIFMRIAVPALGPGLVAEARALFAAALLVPAAWVLGQAIAPAKNWKDYFWLGLVNNAAPFACFSFAAHTLPAGYLAVLNATVPLWTVFAAAWLLDEPFGARRIAGVAVGVAGVALIVNLGPVALDFAAMLALAVGLCGAAAWGLGGVMIKQRSGRVPPVALAAGTICSAALLLSPWWADAPSAAWTAEVAVSAVALGAICTGVAYLAFFRLLRDIGPSRTLSITLLIPALAMLWGWLFLGEPVTWPMLAGAALVFVALALTLRP